MVVSNHQKFWCLRQSTCHHSRYYSTWRHLKEQCQCCQNATIYSRRILKGTTKWQKMDFWNSLILRLNLLGNQLIFFLFFSSFHHTWIFPLSFCRRRPRTFTVSAKAPLWWFPWSEVSLVKVDAIHNARDSPDDGDIIWTVYNQENSVCLNFWIFAPKNHKNRESLFTF